MKMIYTACFLVALLACVLGKICGMGGGVIIKPVMDALNVLPVGAINFLSGCTVLGMSCYSVGKSVVKGESQIDWSISTPLAIGAAAGGFAGKALFALASALFSDENTAGGVQAVLLFLATAATLVYTLRRDRIQKHHVKHPAVCAAIGMALGTLGAFLGIGGGPFNMAVLYFFFSMATKEAAQNSLYVILISQGAGLLKTVLSGGVPELSGLLLLGMILCGVLGSELGGRINRRLTERTAARLLELSMVLVMGICLYNIPRFLL